MTDKWDTLDRYVVISSDTHAGAELYEYKDYLESKWHDDFDAWASSYESPFDDLVDATASRNWDSDYRLEILEEDGIAAEVVFPNTIPPFFNTVHTLADLPDTKETLAPRAAGLRAHNRWLVEFCAKTPGRRLGLIQIMPHDVEAAVAEIQSAAATGVIGGVLIPAIPANHPVGPWFDPRYDPIWGICEELDLPIHQHPGTGAPTVGADLPAARAVMMFEFSDWTRRTLSHLILSGVFERFPKLKAVWTEQGRGIQWVLPELGRMDPTVTSIKASSASRTMPLFASEVIHSLSLTPSEYFARNCYIGASFMPRSEARYIDAVGLDRIMWGSDFPHEEGTTPHSLEALRSTFFDVPEEKCRQLFAGVAANVYGFDLDALTPVAKKIGPKVSEIAVPLTREELPDSNSGAFAGVFSLGKSPRDTASATTKS